MDDNMATVREEARKKGGDELVAKIDAAREKEKALLKELDARLAEALALPEGDERKMGVVAITEALSTAYGKAAVAHGKINGTDDAQIMVLAIRSLVNSIQLAMADRDTAESGVMDMIKNAMKGGKK